MAGVVVEEQSLVFSFWPAWLSVYVSGMKRSPAGQCPQYSHRYRHPLGQVQFRAFQMCNCKYNVSFAISANSQWLNKVTKHNPSTTCCGFNMLNVNSGKFI